MANTDTLPYLERNPRSVEEGRSSGTSPLVLLLHGRAAEAKTIFSIEGLLDPEFRVIAIQAPFDSELGGFEWFPPEAESMLETKNIRPVNKSERMLTRDIQFHVERTGSQNSPLFLWGFSQGAAMALLIGLRGTIQTTGIIPMSGFLPNSVRGWKQWNTNLRVLLAHGSNDEVLSKEASQKTRIFLESKSVAVEYVEYYEYKGRHKMSMESVAYINRWIEQLTSPT